MYLDNQAYEVVKLFLGEWTADQQNMHAYTSISQTPQLIQYVLCLSMTPFIIKLLY